MQKDNFFLQLGLVGFSVLISIFSVYFSYQLFAEYGQADLLKTELAATEKISAPLTYEMRIAKGNQLFQAAYYDLAATEFTLAINIQPENPEAYAKLGETQFKLGENQKALEAFQRAMELTSSQTYSVDYAKALIRTEQFDLANQKLKELSPTQASLFYRVLLEAYYGNHAEAENLLGQAKNLAGPIPAQELQFLQNAYLNFHSQTEGQENYLNAMLTQGMINAEEFQLAEAMAIKILSTTDDYRDVWILLGYAQLKTKQNQEAEDAFKKAKDLDPLKPETHYFLGNSHFLQEEYEDAITELELAILHNFKPEAQAYKLLAESYLKMGKHQEALEAYEFLTKLDPTQIENFMKPIQISVENMKDLDRALTLATESTIQFPADSDSFNALAWVYIERGDFAAAEETLKKALSLDPKNPETHYNLGLLEEARGNLEAAKSAFKTAHELAEDGSDISIQAAEKFNALSSKQNE